MAKNIIIISVLFFTFYLLLFTPFSAGDRYYQRLDFWYRLAKAGEWSQADELEKSLDPADLIVFKKSHHPVELEKYINSLVLKSDKSTEDWLEISRVQSILGKVDESLESLTKAKNLDPIREDVSRIYYQSLRK